MVWCLEHADCAKEIVQCIYESLSIKQTLLHKKIARIYLCSDILANCGARLRDVFYFRQYFGDYLMKIFITLNETLENIQSRIKAEQFRQRVMLCFRMWEDNSIYSTDVLINMQNIFLGLTKPSEDGNVVSDDLDGEPLDVEDDIDGIPLDIDGMPMVSKSLSFASIDGENIDDPPANFYDDEELAISDSISLQKANNDFTTQQFFKNSSWNQINLSAESKNFSSRWDAIEDAPNNANESDDEINNCNGNKIFGFHATMPSPLLFNTNKKRTDSDDEFVKYSKNDNASHKECEEERRKMLREIEVKVMKLQDDLESNRQCRNVEMELTRYRKRLTEKMEEKLRVKSKNVVLRTAEKRQDRFDERNSERGLDIENSDKIRRRHHSRSRNRQREKVRHHDELSTRQKEKEKFDNDDRDRKRDRRR